MRLAAAARFFDRSYVKDAYSLSRLCRGQLDLFDESTRDGVGVDRRVLATAPSVLRLPAHRTIDVDGTRYIVGDCKKDSFNGQVIRDKYVLQQAQVSLVGQQAKGWLQGAGASVTYAGVAWVKDIKLETWSSDPRDMFAFYVATESPLDVDSFLSDGQFMYRVRAAFLTTAGFKALEANRLEDDALSDVTYISKGGAFNPVSNGFTPVAPAVVKGLVMHFHDAYQYFNPAVEKYEPGDTTLRVLQSAVSAQVGDTYAVGGRKYQVLTAYKMPDQTWSLHGRAVNV